MRIEQKRFLEEKEREVQGVKRVIEGIARGRKKVMSKFRSKKTGGSYNWEVFTEFVINEFNKSKQSFREKLGG